jgi:hypothetical protein
MGPNNVEPLSSDGWLALTPELINFRAAAFSNGSVDARTKLAIMNLSPGPIVCAASGWVKSETYQGFLGVYPDGPHSRRIAAMLAVRREEIIWRRCVIADTPPAYWSYLRRYPNGPHAWDARRRLAFLTAALEPPPDFVYFDFGIAPPPPTEVVFVERPVIIFEGPGFAPPAARVLFAAAATRIRRFGAAAAAARTVRAANCRGADSGFCPTTTHRDAPATAAANNERTGRAGRPSACQRVAAVGRVARQSGQSGSPHRSGRAAGAERAFKHTSHDPCAIDDPFDKLGSDGPVTSRRSWRTAADTAIKRDNQTCTGPAASARTGRAEQIGRRRRTGGLSTVKRSY